MAKRRTSLVTWLLILPLSYLAICILLYVKQDAMLFHPTHETEERLERNALALGYLPWRNEAGELIGYQSQAGDPATVLLVFCGNGGHSLDRDYYRHLFPQEAAAWKVYLFEYPGYGARPGPITQASLTRSAIEALNTLASDSARSIYVVGESLGSGIAATAVGENPDRIAGLILVTPYDQLVRVAQNQYPWIPVGFLMKTHFNTEAGLLKYRGPVAVVVAGSDSVIPPARGKAAFELYQGPKRLWVIPDAGHNDDLLTDIWEEIAAWFAQQGKKG